ncbi:hypothetical protein Tco_1178970 [Tanacetum coccineum]
MEPVMGYMGQPMLRYLKSFTANLSISPGSIQNMKNSNRIPTPLSCAYLLANWVANFCIGLILRRLWNPTKSSNEAVENEDLLALWEAKYGCSLAVTPL